MPPERLAIPLNEDPARQKLWRAVRFLCFFTLIVIFGYLLDRVIFYRSTPERWPADAVIQARLIETPRASQHVLAHFAGVQALPGGPWTLEEALSWSKREFIMYSDGHELVGLTVDGEVPLATLESLETWGWEYLTSGRKTLFLKHDADEPLAKRRLINPWLTLPTFDGAITIKEKDGDIRTVPFHIAETHLDFPLDMSEFTPVSTLTLSPETTLLASFTLPAEYASSMLPLSIPAIFPGLQELSKVANSEGLNVLIGRDTEGLALSLSTTQTSMSAEELGAIAHEGVSLQHLSTSVLTISGLPRSQEIRSEDDITVQISSAEGITSAIARDSLGHLFRLTQTATQLIVSNRTPVINPISAKNQDSCLHNPAGFLQPSALHASTLFELPINPGFVHHIQQADEIAFTRNWLRICW